MDAHERENETATYGTEEQKKNALAKQYLQIVHDPTRVNPEAVPHLCAPNKRFVVPTTSPMSNVSGH